MPVKQASTDQELPVPNVHQEHTLVILPLLVSTVLLALISLAPGFRLVVHVPMGSTTGGLV